MQEYETTPTQRFSRLVEGVTACRRCPRMDGRLRVLSLANGNICASVVFIAEAPGRLGADRSGIPLSGDRTGKNFDILLRAAGLERDEIFVTNAILCNPQDLVGRNATPTRGEVKNCSAHLLETLEVIQPRLVVTLGLTALGAIHLISPHGVVLSRDVAIPIEWRGIWLIPLYHPSPRACIQRPLSTQMSDYQQVGRFVHELPDVD